MEDEEVDGETPDEEITQEDALAVISAYFEENGLVRQKLDSFDEFIQNTMQEIVDESADIEIRPESQHNPGHQAEFVEAAPLSVGTRVSGEDVIIGKTSPIPQVDAQGKATRYTKRDHSTSLRHSESGMVYQVLLTTNADGLRFVKVRMRSVRIPQIGITPDIIVNPHAIPSRMTIGQLFECITGKVASHMGKEGDATLFTDVTVDNISKALHKCGYQMCGFETMYNGHTGRKLTAMIFLGPTYYQRLKHMVDDKIHSRGRGPVHADTHQATCRGVLARWWKGYLTRVMHRVHVCEKCGIIAIANLKKNSFECRGCKNKTDIVQVHIPYACKLPFQELMAMAIAPRMLTHDIKTGKDQKKR
ncbi:hypothetical protein ABZP36_018698 [Zizania latifolia]